MKEASYYRNVAWQQLSGKWEPALLFTLLYFLLALMANSIDMVLGGTTILFYLLYTPISYSYNIRILENTRGCQELEIGSLFAGYNDYLRVVGTYFLMQIYVCLWTLLLIVPGIIKAISYSQIFYILHDDPSIAYDKAIERSMAMMEGHKARYFWLALTFVGWYLLGIITLGILYLWITPYVSKSLALFYEDLKCEYENKTATA